MSYIIYKNNKRVIKLTNVVLTFSLKFLVVLQLYMWELHSNNLVCIFTIHATEHHYGKGHVY